MNQASHPLLTRLLFYYLQDLFARPQVVSHILRKSASVLIELAKEIRTAHKRGVELGLSEEELAFYDALETNDSAVQVLGVDRLKTIARELVNTVRHNVTIDWTLRESVRARLRTLVKRLLRKYRSPPDRQEQATQTILEQAELFSRDWAA